MILSIQAQKKCVGKLNARKVFDLIVDHAWKNGEPGIVFIDRMNLDNPTPLIGEIESTNPCGEVPLLPYEACNLGSINLSLMVKQNSKGEYVIDWDKLKDVTNLAIHFLDNVITVNNYPLKEIAKMVQNNRKIGLGVMGWADLLMKLNVSYSSEEGIKLASDVMSFINYHSKVESVRLAKLRGKFANFSGSIYENKHYFTDKFKDIKSDVVSLEDWKTLDKEIEMYGLRNATTTCIAPTGTISMIANCSGGIEPLFSLVFLRNVMDGTEMLEVNDVFKLYAQENKFYSEDLMKQILKDGTLKYCEGVSDEAKGIYVTAHDVLPQWHVKMQAAFQRHTDNAVSKTINFEENASRNDIADAYRLAFEENLKGITVYRNNSRIFQPMNLDKKSEESSIEMISPDEQENIENNIKPRTCPDCGFSIEMAEGCFICPNCGYSGCS